jgi:hypothetical protein
MDAGSCCGAVGALVSNVKGMCCARIVVVALPTCLGVVGGRVLPALWADFCGRLLVLVVSARLMRDLLGDVFCFGAVHSAVVQAVMGCTAWCFLQS